MKIILNIILLVVIQMNLLSQTIVPVGNPIDTSISSTLKRKPLGSFYGFERSALIIRKSELGISAPSLLTKIEFLCDTLNSNAASSTPVKIFISETNDSLFQNGSTILNEEINTFLCFNATLSSTIFSQGNYSLITLSTPFAYSGSGNLKIIIETNAGGTGNESSLAKGFKFSLCSSECFQFWQQDYVAPTGIGSLQKLRPICRLTFDSLSSCTGTPTAGSISSSKTQVCENESFLLSLNNIFNVSGLTFQWQNSNDGSIWNNISSANTTNYWGTITDSTYFRCIVSCSGQSDTTPPLLIKRKELTECYCTNLGGGCNGFSIDSISIQEINFNYASGGCDNTTLANYSSFNLSGQLNDTIIAGISYTLSTKFTGDNVAGFWIDFNRNGFFENWEFNSICTTSVTGTVYSKNFVVPANAVNGQTYLRIRTRNRVAGMDSTMACVNFGSGETEDYKLTIAGGLNVGVKEELKHKLEYSLFPNPVDKDLTIKLNEKINGKIYVSDLLGNVIVQTQIYNADETLIDFSKFRNGLYLIRISTENLEFQSKIIKQ